MSSHLFSVFTGHLASGRWRVKQENDIYFLAHPQPFSRRKEFRIGPDQVQAVTVEEEKGNDLRIKVDFSDDRYCRGQIKRDTLPLLEAMVQDTRAIPLAESQQTRWVIGLSVFFLACILFELFK